MSNIVFHDGFENGLFTVWTGVTGAPSIDGAYAHSGNYGMECGSGDYLTLNANTGIRQFTFYVKIDSAPGGATYVAGNGSYSYIAINSSRKIDLYSSGGGLLASGSTVLATGTWYRLSGSIDSNHLAYIWIDGSIEHDGVDVGSAYDSWGGTSATYPFRLGEPNSNGHYYLDDIALTATTSTDDLGDIRVLAARPVGEGTDQDVNANPASGWANHDSSGVANYSEIDNDPPNDTAFNYADNNNTDRYSATMDQCGSGNLADIGGSDTIEALNCLWYYKTEGGGSDDYGIRVYATDGSQRNYTDDNIDDPKDPTWIAHYMATVPVTSNAWTQTILNTLEMGMGSITAGSKGIWFCEAYAMVAYQVVGGGVTEALVGQASAAVSVTGSIICSRTIVGQSSAGTSVIGLLGITRMLSGTASTVVSITGELGIVQDIVGQTNAAISCTGTLALVKGLSGQTQASVSTTASLVATKSLVSQTNAQTTVSGSLIYGRAIAGQADVAIAVTGSLSVTRILVGQTSAAISISGTLEEIQGIAGQIDAAASVSGNLVALRGFSGQANAAVSVAGTLNVTNHLVGQSNAAISLSGSLGLIKNLSGQTNVAVTMSGTLEISAIVELSGTTTCTISVSGAVLCVRGLVGQTNAAISLTGALVVSKTLVGQTNAAITATGTITTEGDILLVGQTGAAITLVGSLSATLPLSGQTLAAISVTGNLAVVHALSSQTNVVTTVEGSLSAAVPLSGQTDVNVSLTGTLITEGVIPLSGQIIVSVQITGAIVATRSLVSSTVAAIAVTGDLSTGGVQALSGQVLVAISASGALYRQRVLIGVIDVAISASGVVGIYRGMSGQTNVTVTVAAVEIVRTRGLIGATEVVTSLWGSLIGQWSLSGATLASIELTGILGSQIKPAWLLPVNIGSLNAVTART